MSQRARIRKKQQRLLIRLTKAKWEEFNRLLHVEIDRYVGFELTHGTGYMSGHFDGGTKLPENFMYGTKPDVIIVDEVEE